MKKLSYRNKKQTSLGGRVFDGINVTLLFIFAVSAILPFIYVMAGSLATEHELTTRPFFLVPRDFQIDTYKYILSSNTISKSLVVSVFITIAGTLVNMFFTVTMAYPLSKKSVAGRDLLLKLVVFSMLFSGGMIPTYLIVRNVGLIDSYASLIIPFAINAFNLIIIKNFFQNLPQELEEAAIIDGCSEIGLLFRIVLPLSMPVLAAFTLFYAVEHWNSFFRALLYINDYKKWPLQVILRNMIMQTEMKLGDMSTLADDFVEPPAQSLKMAVITVSTIPILCVYPFLQKHFAEGVLLGSVKG